MITTNYRYNINFTTDETENKVVILSQLPYFKGTKNSLHIPLDDIDDIIESLQSAKDEIRKIELKDIHLGNKFIEPGIVNTLASLFLSGIPVNILSKQYNIDEEIVRINLEEKGIILMDDI